MILHLHINYDEQNFEFYKENFFFCVNIFRTSKRVRRETLFLIEESRKLISALRLTYYQNALDTKGYI